MKSSRRELLKTGAAALAGVCLARAALAQAKASKRAPARRATTPRKAGGS